jgi:hypothetical protein
MTLCQRRKWAVHVARVRDTTDAYKISVRKPVKGNYSGNLGVDWRMVWILKKQDVKVLIGFSFPAICFSGWLL